MAGVIVVTGIVVFLAGLIVGIVGAAIMLAGRGRWEYLPAGHAHGRLERYVRHVADASRGKADRDLSRPGPRRRVDTRPASLRSSLAWRQHI